MMKNMQSLLFVGGAIIILSISLSSAPTHTATAFISPTPRTLVSRSTGISATTRIQTAFHNTVKQATLIPSTTLFLSQQTPEPILPDSADDDDKDKSLTNSKNSSTGDLQPTPTSSSSIDQSKATLDQITAQAEAALQEAEDALQAEQTELENAKRKAAIETQRQQQLQRQMQQQKQQKQISTQRQIEAFVSGIGAFLFGTISGSIMDIFLKVNNLDLDVDLIIPPALLAASFSVAAVTFALQDGETGALVRNVFAGPLENLTNSIKNAITAKIEETVDDIKATPTKIQSAIEQKVQQTTDEIKQIPITVRDNIEQKVQQTTDEIKQIPKKAKDAAASSVEKLKDDVNEATVRTVEEIKATPGRIVKETQDAIDRTVEDIEEKVEKTVDVIKKSVDDVVSLPSKAIGQVCLLYFIMIW